ncbi:hypothetical protein [Streptomyces sp. NPDC054863]
MSVLRAGKFCLATSAVLVLTACSGMLTGDDGASGTSVSGAGFDERDPATWKLPVESYMLSATDQEQLSKAQAMLTEDCMERFGFRWKPAPDLPAMGPKTLTDWRYGIHDGDLAKERGYRPAADEQAAYNKAMEAGAVDETPGDSIESKVLSGQVNKAGGKDVPAGGCTGEAARQVQGDGSHMSTLPQDIANEAFLRSKKEPAVIKAFARWSACMKESGYAYKEPLDASDDPQFSSNEVTRQEIATATADIGCRERTKVATIWFEAESALQSKEIEKKAESLDKTKKDMDAAVKKTASVLARTR